MGVVRNAAQLEEVHDEDWAVDGLLGGMVAEGVVAAAMTEGTDGPNAVEVVDSAGQTTNRQPEQTDSRGDTGKGVGWSTEARHDARDFDVRAMAQTVAVVRRLTEVGGMDAPHGGTEVGKLAVAVGKGVSAVAATEEAHDTNTYYDEAAALGQSDNGEARLIQGHVQGVHDSLIVQDNVEGGCLCLGVSLGSRDMRPLRTFADDSEATTADWRPGVAAHGNPDST